MSEFAGEFVVTFCRYSIAQVPVSSNVLDECVSALFNGNTEEIEADIFTAAESEVFHIIPISFDKHFPF